MPVNVKPGVNRLGKVSLSMVRRSFGASEMSMHGGYIEFSERPRGLERVQRVFGLSGEPM